MEERDGVHNITRNSFRVYGLIGGGCNSRYLNSPSYFELSEFHCRYDLYVLLIFSFHYYQLLSILLLEGQSLVEDLICLISLL